MEEPPEKESHIVRISRFSIQATASGRGKKAKIEPARWTFYGVDSKGVERVYVEHTSEREYKAWLDSDPLWRKANEAIIGRLLDNPQTRDMVIQMNMSAALDRGDNSTAAALARHLSPETLYGLTAGNATDGDAAASGRERRRKPARKEAARVFGEAECQLEGPMNYAAQPIIGDTQPADSGTSTGASLESRGIISQSGVTSTTPCKQPAYFGRELLERKCGSNPLPVAALANQRSREWTDLEEEVAHKEEDLSRIVRRKLELERRLEILSRAAQTEAATKSGSHLAEPGSAVDSQIGHLLTLLSFLDADEDWLRKRLHALRESMSQFEKADDKEETVYTRIEVRPYHGHDIRGEITIPENKFAQGAVVPIEYKIDGRLARALPKMPALVKDGSTIRFPGLGAARNPRGDLYLSVQVKQHEVAAQRQPSVGKARVKKLPPRGRDSRRERERLETSGYVSTVDMNLARQTEAARANSERKVRPTEPQVHQRSGR